MVASQLQNSSHHLVNNVFPTFERVDLVTEDVDLVGWSLTGAGLGYVSHHLGSSG